MSTSRGILRFSSPSPLGRSLEAAGLAVVLALLPELVWPRTGMLPIHTGWLVVLVLSARDGSAGFFTGLVAATAATVIGSALAGYGGAAWSHFDSGLDLIALGACLAVSWVASWHLRRQADLRERLGALAERVSEAGAANQALRDVVARLRTRVDRAATSLSFLRDVAARLDGTDPVAAAEAAADLALARTGASAAMVQVGVGGTQRPLAVRDARGATALAPLDLREADVTVPIRNGTPVGALTLWGVPGSSCDEATANDLAIIATWCLPALAVAAWRPETHGSARRAG